MTGCNKGETEGGVTGVLRGPSCPFSEICLALKPKSAKVKHPLFKLPRPGDALRLESPLLCQLFSTITPPPKKKKTPPLVSPPAETGQKGIVMPLNGHNLNNKWPLLLDLHDFLLPNFLFCDSSNLQNSGKNGTWTIVHTNRCNTERVPWLLSVVSSM